LKFSCVSHSETLQKHASRILWLLWFSLLISNSGAQESIRPSLTGDLASEARRPAQSTGNYLLKAGPVDFNASASLDVEYNDNVGLAEKDRLSDLILRPTLNISSEWKVTSLNTLRFNIGIGYAYYTQHHDLDTRSALLDPGSELAFDVYVGGVLKLTFHDRFAIVQNPIDEPTLSNTARFDRFQNAAGVTAVVDLNDVKFVVGYDHFDYRSFDSQFNFLNRQEEQFYGSTSVRLSDAVTVGVDASGGLIRYEQDFNNNGYDWSAGPFVEATLSNYVTLRLSGGYQAMTFDGSGTNGDTTNYGGFYGNFTIAQRLNQYWTHSVSIGHEARLGLEVNFYEYNYARYLATWQLNPRMSLSLEGFAEDANESGTAAQNSEHSFRWGGSAALSWRLGARLTATLRYSYVNKDSDLDLRSYYQNVGTFGLGYDF
jgi:hypothetical protein